MNVNVHDYVGAGFRVFGIYGKGQKTSCECGHPKCDSAFKHPRLKNWQLTPEWSDEQIANMEEAGHFKSGFGVLVSGFLIVDVDARNGGLASLDKLRPVLGGCGFIVATGSGGGSCHYYFKLPEGVSGALVQHLRDYPGIDFKSSGYVVGAGSLHKSGNVYERIHGHPEDVTEAPGELLALLARAEHYSTQHEGIDVHLNDAELADMLSYIDPNSMDYEGWIRVGMALHEATGGAVYDLWCEWSARSEKHDEAMMFQKWQSFGRSAVRATLGTLIHYAKDGGWEGSVTFVPTVNYDFPADAAPDVIDLLRPPGFVGELTKWINSNCLYPRENLAVAAALMAVSNICGLRYRDEMDGITPNLIAFCVAGSGSGKESVLKCYSKILKTAGMAPALYGAFKSEQELYRNLIRHQPAIYCVDEWATQLGKIKNASKSGASYLEGLIGAVMSVYSKADSFLPVTGDLKEEIRGALAKELAAVNKQLDMGEKVETRLKAVERQLSNIDQGIEAPYLTILGVTSPVNFMEMFDFETATNGFLSRAVLFRELETNPRRKTNFQPVPMSDGMEFAIASMITCGRCSDELTSRIEYGSDKISIPTTDDARALLDEAYEDFWQMAEAHKSRTGLEAIPRRGYELAAKVSLVLAMPEGLRTAEHVRWAVALAKRDIEQKIALAFSNSSDDASTRIALKILAQLDKDHAESKGTIRNRLRGFDHDAIDAVLEHLVNVGKIKKIEAIHPANKKIIEKFQLC